MITEVKRDDIQEKNYREILDKESHHDHKIIKDKNGVLRWMEHKEISKLFEKIDFNDFVEFLYDIGLNKNSEIYRKLYHCIGYSLHGYWEVFYWELNNKDAAKYKGKQLEKINPDKCRKYIDILKKLSTE